MAWTSADIGTIGLNGSVSLAGGQVTIKGAGDDLWSTGDDFTFYYREFSGDVVVTARVVSIDGEEAEGTGNAGVMIRESLSDGSKYAAVLMREGKWVDYKRRTTTGGTTSVTSDPPEETPYWVRVVRSGDTLEGYKSDDGQSWTLINSVTVTMNSTVLVGLAVSSNDPTAYNTVVFDNVTIE